MKELLALGGPLLYFFIHFLQSFQKNVPKSLRTEGDGKEGPDVGSGRHEVRSGLSASITANYTLFQGCLSNFHLSESPTKLLIPCTMSQTVAHTFLR